MKEKKLIVNADDFGLSEGINKGIIDSFRNGIVRSASIIPTGVAFDHAVSLTKENPDLDIGVHLTLIAEKPVLGESMISSLINSDGCFFDSHWTFIFRYLVGRVSLSEVALELEAQIGKVVDCGLKVTHIDSHRHLHMLPGILKIVVDLARKFNIKGIRLTEGAFFHFYDLREVGLQLLGRISKKKLLNLGLNFPDYFLGLAWGGKLSEENILNLLGSLKPGITELMCHPGFLDKTYIERYSSWGYKPEVERAALTSESVKAKLEELRISLINFGDLSPERKGS